MARNHKFFFDADRIPRARGPAAEKMLMSFLEADVQGSDPICRDLMDDLIAIDDGSDDRREFVGNAHSAVIDKDGVLIEPLDHAAKEAGSHASAGTEGVGEADASPVQPDPSLPGGNAATPGPEAANAYRTGLKHFREVLEDWEAFILDDGTDDLGDDSLLDDEFA